MKSMIIKLIIFSVAFAFVEAAVVVYLRHLLGASFSGFNANKEDALLLLPGIAFLQPQTALSVMQDSALLRIEMIREAATLIMLGAVALLCSREFKKTLAYFFLSFGIWDIFYYVFLNLTIGWPTSFGDQDIFFLLPVPWVGPVFVPIAISLTLCLGALYYLKRQITSHP